MSLAPRPATWPGCPTAASAPASISDLCGITDQIPGVHLDRLLGQLTDDPAVAQHALDALLAGARAAMAQQEPTLPGIWPPGTR